MNDKDLPLLLEISHAPDDCLINHNSRTQLKRLLNLELIEVETRNISAWHKPIPRWCLPDGSDNPEYDEWGRYNKARTWKNRSEVHAKLTPAGHAWLAEFRTAENRVLSNA